MSQLNGNPSVKSEKLSGCCNAPIEANIGVVPGDNIWRDYCTKCGCVVEPSSGICADA